MKTRKIALASLAAVLVAGTAVPSFAGPGRDGRNAGRGGMMQEMTFVRLLKTADANKDARITKEELAARQDTLFGEIDANKDGNLIPGELRAYRDTKMEQVRKDRAERREERRKQMAENDQSGDDDRPGWRGERRHEGGRWGMHHGRMGGAMGGVHLARQADTDENGQYSKAEVTAAVDTLFTRLDSNKDGVFSIDDLPERPF